MVVLNRQHPPEAQVVALAAALRQLGRVDELYLRPAVRAALEDTWMQSDAGLIDDADGDEADGDDA